MKNKNVRILKFDSNHLSKNIVYRKLLIQRHSIKTLRMVSKILHMFVVACTGKCSEFCLLLGNGLGFGVCWKMFRVLSFVGKWFERHSIKTLRMVSKILHMFVVACTTFPKHQLSPLNQVDDNRIQF
jgi:hypothetical protein